MYFSPEKNKIIEFRKIQEEYNITLPPAVKTIDADLANLLGLVKVLPSEEPDYDPTYQQVVRDLSSITYKDGDSTATYGFTIRNLISPDVDEEGNVVKSIEEILAEREAQQIANKEADAKAAEELANQAELDGEKGWRDGELQRTDIFVSVPDYPLPLDSTADDWVTYRAELRAMFDEAVLGDATTFSRPTAPDYVEPEPEEEPTEE